MINQLPPDNQPAEKKMPKRILYFLTAYPYLWSLGILVGGLTGSQTIIMFTMLTWVIAFYFGTFIWLCLVIYLYLHSRLTMKEIFLHFLVASIGIIFAYFIYECDIFNSGLKFMD